VGCILSTEPHSAGTIVTKAESTPTTGQPQGLSLLNSPFYGGPSGQAPCPSSQRCTLALKARLATPLRTATIQRLTVTYIKIAAVNITIWRMTISIIYLISSSILSTHSVIICSLTRNGIAPTNADLVRLCVKGYGRFARDHCPARAYALSQKTISTATVAPEGDSQDFSCTLPRHNPDILSSSGQRKTGGRHLPQLATPQQNIQISNNVGYTNTPPIKCQRTPIPGLSCTGPNFSFFNGGYSQSITGDIQYQQHVL